MKGEGGEAKGSWSGRADDEDGWGGGAKTGECDCGKTTTRMGRGGGRRGMGR